MTSMTIYSIAVLALVGLPLSPAVAVDESTLSGPYVFALTRDIEGCLKPLALEPHVASVEPFPKARASTRKNPLRTNFILTCIEDGREPQCLYIPAEILRAAQPRIDGIQSVQFGVDAINAARSSTAHRRSSGCTCQTGRDRGHREGFPSPDASPPKVCTAAYVQPSWRIRKGSTPTMQRASRPSPVPFGTPRASVASRSHA